MKKNIYLVGIKGVGMTMLAQFLKMQGNQVSGSDIEDVFMTDKVLADLKIPVFSPFSINNLPLKTDLIIYSTAFSIENNLELKEIQKSERFSKTPVLIYAQAFGDIFSQQKGIAVCGSHGKTTTSAWLGYVLWQAGKSPSVLVGSRVPQFKSSGLKGKSKIFVAEVDEYQNKLQYFQPHGVVLNNIDYDHPDFFKTEADYVTVFAKFIKKIPQNGFLVFNNRDQDSCKIAKTCLGRTISYDFSENGESVETVNYLAYDLKIKNGYQIFKVNNFGEFKIKLWGKHNILNALAVIAAALELKVSIALIKKHLGGFDGTERRSQVLGNYKKALIIDDYAHHPTEIRTTLAGIKARYPKKNLRVVFHPHTFTRTKALFKDFVTSFSLTNELIVLDIYGSAREQQGGVSSKQLVAAVKSYNKKQGTKQNVLNISNLNLAKNYISQTVRANDLILLMGAGDVFRLGEELLCRKKKKK